MFLILHTVKEVCNAATELYSAGADACRAARRVCLSAHAGAGADRFRAGGADPGVQDGDAGAAAARGDDLGAEPRAHGGLSKSDGAQSRAAARAAGAAPAPPQLRRDQSAAGEGGCGCGVPIERCVYGVWEKGGCASLGDARAGWNELLFLVCDCPAYESH